MYKKLYAIIFHTAADAWEELEKLNIGRAKEILRSAQITAEKQYMDAEEEGAEEER